MSHVESGLILWERALLEEVKVSFLCETTSSLLSNFEEGGEQVDEFQQFLVINFGWEAILGEVCKNCFVSPEAAPETVLSCGWLLGLLFMLQGLVQHLLAHRVQVVRQGGQDSSCVISI